MYKKLIPPVRVLCQVTVLSLCSSYSLFFFLFSSPPNKLSQYHGRTARVWAETRTIAKESRRRLPWRGLLFLFFFFVLLPPAPLPFSFQSHTHTHTHTESAVLPPPRPHHASVPPLRLASVCQRGVAGVSLQSGSSCCFVESGGLWGVSTGDRCGRTSFRRRCTGMASLRSGSGGGGTARPTGRTCGEE